MTKKSKTENFRPYPKYKDSGVPWLGEIPEGWDVFRNGRLFAQRNQTGFGELPILEVSLKTGVRVRDMENMKRKQVMSNREKYKRAKRGDIAYNMMRMWQGAVGVAPVDGLVSPAYVVARPFPEVNTRFFTYLFRTAAYMNEVDGYSRGIVKDRNRLYWQDFKAMPSVAPPPGEQRQIARFLDWKTTQINRFIRNKRQLIALLREQKQNIINRAVTRGLDPKVKLKPSGVDWLGDVPEHWEVRKLKFLSHQILGGATPTSDNVKYWDGSIVWVTPQDISQNEYLVSSIRTITTEGLSACSATLVPKGAVVITSRAPVGNVAIAGVELSTNQGCKSITPDHDVLSTEFCFFILKSWQPILQAISNGTTFKEISTWKFANVKIPVPLLKEQNQIVEYIGKESASIDATIQRAEQEIELILEYRNRLIFDAVTGKIDVRDVSVPEADAVDLTPLDVDEEFDEDDSIEEDEGDTDDTD